MYIVVGIALILLLSVLLILDRFTPFSEFMSSFKPGTFKKLMWGLSLMAVLSLTYGTYHALTYQPPFIDVKTQDGSRTIMGDIGTVGYYAEELVQVDQPADLHLVRLQYIQLYGHDTTNCLSLHN